MKRPDLSVAGITNGEVGLVWWVVGREDVPFRELRDFLDKYRENRYIRDDSSCVCPSF